ncbi:MAG: cupin domain-containing protein [Acidobacteria bacterium]|nr:cupin domain-containing protein [Acidobacteriota bacterium]MBA3886247.1 cupin domain-containing protein [Acidobacteriota bacterium]
MRAVSVLVTIVLAAATASVSGQGRGRAVATLVIVVSDPAGNPLPGVLVTAEGPADRATRTERGRVVFEKIPTGAYRLRFEREGFVTLERELTARAGAPMEVNVTLSPVPPPPEPEAPPPPPRSDARPAVFALPDTIEKDFIGRAPQRTSSLACGSHGTATLIQLNQPLAQHAHDEADEFLYVIAGEGAARLDGREERLRAGVLLFIPSGVPHTLTQTGRNPLILLSTMAGEGCAAAPAPR